MPKMFWLASLALVLTVTTWEMLDRAAFVSLTQPAQASLTLSDPQRVINISRASGEWEYTTDIPSFAGVALPKELFPIKSETDLAVISQVESVLSDFYPSDKWIQVNLSDQTLTAYQADSPIWTFPVSTGLLRTPTPNGEFRIWIKLRYHRMVGAGYDLPNVPFVQYFHQGYGLHGVYWHGNWGTPMSHGCVNMRTEDAELLYYWTDPWVPEGDWGLKANNNANSESYNPGTRILIIGDTRDAYK